MKKTNKQLEQENLKLKKQVEKLQNAPATIEGVKLDAPSVMNTDMESIMLTFGDRISTLKQEIGRTYQFVSKMRPVPIEEPQEYVHEMGHINALIYNLCVIGDLTNSLNKINNQLETIA